MKKLFCIEDTVFRVDHIDYMRIVPDNKKVLQLFFAGNSMSFTLSFDTDEIARQYYNDIKTAICND